MENFNDFSQVRAPFRPQNQVSRLPPSVPAPQHYENIPPSVVPQLPVQSSLHQSSNFEGFLQQVDFSVPPPFPPPVLPGLVFGPPQIPCYYPDLNLSNSTPLHGISTNQRRPYENEHWIEKESSVPEKCLLRCKNNDEKPQIQLHDFSDKLKNFYSSLLKLKNNLDDLNSIGSQLDFASWSDRIASLSSQRASLEKLKRAIKIDSTSLSFLRYKIKKRLKKRKTRRRKNSIETKPMSKYEIASLHMQQLQQTVDKQKQEEKYKEEADAILFSVRQKKSEANIQIQFLSALSKLHAARINATNAQTKSSLYDSVDGFNKIIDKLKSMWQCQMEEYLIEENGLNIMVKDLALSAEDVACSKMKETCDQWSKLLFGTTNFQKISYFSNLNELIEIRRDWDKYAVDEEENSSKIPAGWVVPRYPRDDAWSRFIS